MKMASPSRIPVSRMQHLEEINGRIKSIARVIKTLQIEDRAYFCARLRRVELKKEKMLALATIAQTQCMQGAIAEMDVLLAENDLMIEIESFGRAQCFRNSEQRFLNGPARNMEDLDTTLLIGFNSGASSTPLKNSPSRQSMVGQFSPTAKLDTHAINILQVTKPLENQPVFTNSVQQIENDKVTVNLIEEPFQFHFEDISSNTDEASTHNVNSQIEEDFTETVEVLLAKETAEILSKQNEFIQPQCLQTTRQNEINISGHLLQQTPDQLLSINKADNLALYPTKDILFKSETLKSKKKRSQKEKDRLFDTAKIIKTSEKSLKSVDSGNSHPRPEVTKVMHIIEISKNNIPTKEINTGSSVINNATEAEASKDSIQNDAVLYQSKSHKDIISLHNTYIKIFKSPEDTPVKQPNLEDKSKTIKQATIEACDSLKQFVKTEEKTKDKNVLDISKRNLCDESSKKVAKKSHSQDATANKTKQSHETEAFINNNRVSRDFIELPPKKLKLENSVSQANKDQKSQRLPESFAKHASSSSSDICTRNSKQSNEHLESSKHKHINKSEKYTATKEKKSHHSSKKHKKRSYKTEYSSKRDGNTTDKHQENNTKKNTDTNNTISCSYKERNENLKNNYIANNEKAISYLNNVVKQAMENNVTNVHLIQSQEDIVNNLFRDLMAAKVFNLETDCSTSNTISCLQCGPVSEGHMCAYTLRELLEQC